MHGASSNWSHHVLEDQDGTCRLEITDEDGVVFLAHYVAGPGRVGQSLMCFCSTRCLLLWEHPSTMGLMH